MPKKLIEFTDEELVEGLVFAAVESYNGEVDHLKTELMRRLGHPEYTPPKEDADV
jgi:hypothetical protein